MEIERGHEQDPGRGRSEQPHAQQVQEDARGPLEEHLGHEVDPVIAGDVGP